MKENLGSAKPRRMCVTVLGSSSVGKTALTVRYLTGRYIGDYYSGTDMTYRHSVPYLGGSLSTNIDILDVSRPMENVDDGLLFSEKMNAFLVVYSLTDSRSFASAKEILSRLPFSAPKYLVANQLDLQHRRQVTRVEGQTLANHFGCPFDEFSAAEIVNEEQYCVKVAFQKLIRQLMTHSYILPYPRIRFSSFSKLLVTLVSKTRQAANCSSLQHRKLRRGLSSNSSQSSTSSRSSRGSSSSRGSETSIATITSETSDLSIANMINSFKELKSKPIPITESRVRNSSIKMASI